MCSEDLIVDQVLNIIKNTGMSDPYVFDKAKYHYTTVEEYGLPETHACHHTAYFLRWLIENDLMSEFFKTESSPELANLGAGKISVLDLYKSWDGCLIDEMVSDLGNEFGKSYFDFEKGQYIHDYVQTLQGELKSEFHIPFNDENYAKLKPVLDRRFAEWKRLNSRAWWKLWK